jgi:hypothetical protein
VLFWLPCDRKPTYRFAWTMKKLQLVWFKDKVSIILFTANLTTAQEHSFVFTY